jgi:hypothetical protein
MRGTRGHYSGPMPWCGGTLLPVRWMDGLSEIHAAIDHALTEPPSAAGSANAKSCPAGSRGGVFAADGSLVAQ